MRNLTIRHVIIATVVLTFSFAMGATGGLARNYLFNYGKMLANGKTCRVVLGDTHFHSANGADARKSRARAMAIADWSSFVVFE